MNTVNSVIIYPIKQYLYNRIYRGKKMGFKRNLQVKKKSKTKITFEKIKLIKNIKKQKGQGNQHNHIDSLCPLDYKETLQKFKFEQKLLQLPNRGKYLHKGEQFNIA